MFLYRRLVSLFKSSCLIGIFWLLCTACAGESSEEQAATTDSTVTETPAAAPAAFAGYSPKFQKILKTPDGMIRGVSIGDLLTQVKQKEQNQPMEDSTGYISFNVELGNDEMTDVLYYYSPQQQTVRSITLDIYLNDQQSVDSLAQEFTRYFTDHYGQPAIREPKASGWQDTQHNRIVLQDVGIPQAPGLRIQVAPGPHPRQ